MKIKLLCFIGLLVLFFANIKKSSFDDDFSHLLKSFTQCDKTFFLDLNQKKYHNYFPIITLPTGYSKFATISNNNSVKNKLIFDPPIIFNGLKIESFEQSEYITNEHLKFYFWGFNTDNTFEEIKSALSWVDWQISVDGTLDFANASFYKNGVWSDNKHVLTDTSPERGTAENLLFLEYDNDRLSGKAIIQCTIQGDIPEKELWRFRPDLWSF